MRKAALLLAVLLAPAAALGGARVYSVPELKSAPPKSGRCWVEGYVTKVYVCPPCPEGAACKPCMKPNLVLSAKDKRAASYDELGGDDLIVFTNDANKVPVGRKRRLKVKLLDGRAKGEPVKEVEALK